MNLSTMNMSPENAKLAECLLPEFDARDANSTEIDRLMTAAREQEAAKWRTAVESFTYRSSDGRRATQPAYEPEEAGVWGGEDLDALCDEGIERLRDGGAVR